MSDKELLAAAAKAAGLELTADNFIAPGEIPALTEEWGLCTGLGPTFWNPLTDDGDALRLAVKLGICVEFGYCEDDAPVVWTGPVEERRDWPRYPNFPDPYAATRRAIVRAAAALAERKE